MPRRLPPPGLWKSGRLRNHFMPKTGLTSNQILGRGDIDVGELAVPLCVRLDGRPFATGMGRILSDGSVVGAVRIHGQGEPRFHTLPAGTVRIDGQFLCASVAGLPYLRSK